MTSGPLPVSAPRAPDSAHSDSAHPDAAGRLAGTLLPVASAAIDRRSAERADPSFLTGVLRGPGTMALLVSQRRAAFDGERLALLPAGLLPAAWLEGLVVYLGRLPADPAEALAAEGTEPGTDVVLVALPEPVEPVEGVLPEPAVPGAELLPDGARWAGFREAGAVLDAVEASLLIEATAIANWHEGHVRCPRCGAPTEVVHSGWVRRCPQDGSEHFPRTDPAIIVTVVGPDGRLLLGTGAQMRSTMYSTLAGFVEPGESLEQAVVREIAEEVGVRVTDCQYLGSQPWPFPASLMLGFTARTEDVAAEPDGAEVVRARWFEREELQAAVLSGEITLPSSISIARALIEHWFGGRIAEPAGTGR
ncbi:NAD(+) diphosphatase [Sinomonas mesophila]|uniref:NAD(+) diphosphatase n=1 Tax=Sinomonas mesophila TaxID=1531955 RepID=UPI000984445D|nr:NAD(+) diphosphatase [Sinomonas mesophila]